jgi:hypothetical protein
MARVASPAGPRPGRRGALLPVAALLLIACGDGPAAPGAESSAASPLPAAPSARRPTRRYYFTRTPTRCEIYAQDGDERTEPFATPCLEHLLVGERIRIAGKTCFLENKAQPERERPVVCPDPLTRFEKQDRGELK